MRCPRRISVIVISAAMPRYVFRIKIGRIEISAAEHPSAAALGTDYPKDISYILHRSVISIRVDKPETAELRHVHDGERIKPGVFNIQRSMFGQIF